MAPVPFALSGGVWLTWLMGYSISIASAIGFIALAGVAAEYGVVMLVYLKNTWERRSAFDRGSQAELIAAIEEGAVIRLRPKSMTVAVILAGLLPIMWAAGTGSEIMQRIAAPMVGGMITAPLLSLFVIPAAWFMMARPSLPVRRRDRASVAAMVDAANTSSERAASRPTC